MALAAVGMEHKATQTLAEMSDGERQKIMIAKVLAQECPIVVLDEPTAFLDVSSRIEVMLLLRQLAAGQQKSILLSTHDIDQAIRMGDRLWLLEKDSSTACGAPEDLILEGRFEAFFGKEGITFDPTTGKLCAPEPELPVGIEGDPLTADWAGNALVRNGRKPSPPSPHYPVINCLHRHCLVISFPNGIQREANSIQQALEICME
jgi:iron complex transport system ATP-binding protein